jgi:hypothetical protein
MAMEPRECTWTSQYRRYGSLSLFKYSYTTEVFCLGVHIHLNGETIEGNESVSITDVGENDAAVLCMTDKEECCIYPPGRAGEWYYPSNEVVGHMGTVGDFYRNRGRGVVRLNRRNNAMMPTGSFCCEIPDRDNVTQRMIEASMITPDADAT